MFRAQHSITEVLRDRSGAGILEGIGGITLFLIAVGALTFGIATNMQALTGIASKAERQAVVTALVGDEHATTWGTASQPTTKTITLPNGRTVPVTTWREDSAASTRLTAVTPVSADEDAVDCSGPSAVAKSGCLYASRVHAKDADELSPRTVIRKHPSMGGKATGTVDARVSTAQTLPQGATIASFTEPASTGSASILRYLIDADALPGGAEIVITQGANTLAVIPVDTGMHSYFGTINTAPGSQVRVSVTSGNVAVKSVFLYNVRSTP